MRRFFRLIAILAVLPFAVECRDVYYLGDLTPRNITPSFDKGYLAVYEKQTIALYGPDGSLTYRATPLVPGATWTDVLNAAPDSDGTLAIALEYSIDKLSGGGIAIFDPSGTQKVLIDTGREYFPTQVCFGPDHSVWAMGWRGLQRRDVDASEKSAADYFVLRNYTLDGHLVGAFLPRSSFEQEPVGPMVGVWQVRIANGRVGGLFYASSVLAHGTERRMAEWIETDLLGNVVKRVDMPQKRVRAFLSDGSLYALGFRGGYSVLNPTDNAWRPIPGVPNGILLGAEANSLVFLIRGTNRVVWSPLE